MDYNLAQWDRYLRVIFGVMFLTYAFAGGPIWAYLGFFPLITGAVGFCPIFGGLNISTKRVDD